MCARTAAPPGPSASCGTSWRKGDPMPAWPTGREHVTAHVAAEPEDGVQKCSRCLIVLHASRTGADPPWYPGQRVGVADTGTVRMSLREGHGHRECDAG